MHVFVLQNPGCRALFPARGKLSTGSVRHIKVAESRHGLNAGNALFPCPCILFKVRTNTVRFPVFFVDSLFYVIFIKVIYI